VRPFRSLGLRARLILLGLAGLSAGLLVGGVVLAGSLQYAVQKTVDTGALRTAQTVKDLYESGRLVSPITNLGTQVAAVQVLDSQNRVRAASSGAELTPMLEPRELAAVRAGKRLVVPGDRALTDGPLRIVAVTAGPSTDRRLIVVAAPVAQLESSTRLLRTALLIFFPLLVGAVALIAWWLIGKTLRPVEALRRGAEEITGTGSATLLPVPDPPDEIHRLAVTLNGMLARLESSRRRQRAFVADAAHELRSPLASTSATGRTGQPLRATCSSTSTGCPASPMTCCCSRDQGRGRLRCGPSRSTSWRSSRGSCSGTARRGWCRSSRPLIRCGLPGIRTRLPGSSRTCSTTRSGTRRRRSGSRCRSPARGPWSP
jgi:HAMP domain-containing protein